MSKKSHEDRLPQPGGPPCKGEAFYKALFESASDAIFLLCADTFVDCNPRTSELFGYPRAELLGRSPYDFSPPLQPDGEDSKAKAIGKIEAALEGRVQRFDWRHLRQDGTALDAEVGLTRIEIDDEILLLAVVRDVTAQRRAEAALRKSRAALRSLATKITQVEDTQRIQIAQGLHDTAAQNLAAAALLLRQIAAGDLQDGARSSLTEVIALVDQTAEQLRDLSFQLSPPNLSELGLEAALEDLADRLSKLHGIQITIEDLGAPRPLPIDTRSVVYRCVAELLANAVRHAKAQKVTTRISWERDRFMVTVSDDGVGFDATDAGNGIHGRGGFGLFSVRERLRALGGELELQSIPDDGTRAVMRVPLHEPGPQGGAR